MSYGSPDWQSWVLGEEEGTYDWRIYARSDLLTPLLSGLEHIKAAYDLGINAFDTANVYSNGLSEVILGKAIKKYNLPRDEIVVMTKLYATVARDISEASLFGQSIDFVGKKRYTNQQGMSRKVRTRLDLVITPQC